MFNLLGMKGLSGCFRRRKEEALDEATLGRTTRVPGSGYERSLTCVATLNPY